MNSMIAQSVPGSQREQTGEKNKRYVEAASGRSDEELFLQTLFQFG